VFRPEMADQKVNQNITFKEVIEGFAVQTWLAPDFHTIIGKSTKLFSISPVELSFKTYLEKCLMFVWYGWERK